MERQETGPSNARRRIDWDHVVFASFLAGFCLWYLIETLSVSTDFQNWLLIAPASLLGLGIYLFIIGAEVLGAGPDPKAPARAGRPPLDVRVLAFMALVGLYVISMPFIGFDTASVLFLVAALRLQGERRWPLVIGYSAVVGLGAAWVFKSMLSVPVPTLLPALQ